DDDRARDLQHALRRAAIFARDQLGLGDVGDDAHAALVERFTRLGQGDAPGGAVEQPDPEALFQPVDAARDRRARDVERLCGRREAGVIAHAGEDADLVVTRHDASYWGFLLALPIGAF